MKRILIIATATLILSSCSQTILNYTVLSNHATPESVQQDKPKVLTGKSIKFLGLGVSVTDAVQDALNGTEYKRLINGKVEVIAYPLFSGYKVTGVGSK